MLFYILLGGLVLGLLFLGLLGAVRRSKGSLGRVGGNQPNPPLKTRMTLLERMTAQRKQRAAKQDEERRQNLKRDREAQSKAGAEWREKVKQQNESRTKKAIANFRKNNPWPR